MDTKRQRHLPICFVAHDIINKLSVIVGHADLLLEKTEKDTDYAKRLTLIRDIAEQSANELKQHQRDLAAQIRKPEKRKAS
jgi:signal transduction histidine kinase